MSYSEVKTQFSALLNRRDLTASLITTFMSYAIQRIQRELRVPAMERLAEITTDGTSSIDVPGDLLEIISVHTNDETNHDKLTKTDLGTILVWSRELGIPRYYYRETSTLSLGPYPAEGTTVWIHYYADASPLLNDIDENWLTEIAPALLVYAALSYAADYFMDDRKPLFEASYLQIAEQLQIQALNDETANASIRPSFSTD